MNDINNTKNNPITAVLKDIKSDWKFLAIILTIGLVIHIILWIGWPLHAGADADTYIYYYFDSFNSSPIFHNLMCFRTPVAPFFFCILLTLGGSILTSIVLEVLALTAILIIYLTVIPWGKWVSRIISIIFVFLITYQIQFHQVGSDALFAWFILLFFLFLRYSIQYNNLKLWTILGIIIALTTLTRPGGFALILVIIFIPFLKIGWKKTLTSIMVVLISSGIILGGYVLYKGIRYDDFSIARGFNHTISYRIYRLQDNAINPENGPYTKKIIGIIENDILTTDVYKNYDVSLEDFLTYKPNSRFHGDLISMVDLKEGWVSNYKLLFQVSYEAIKSQPKIFVKTYINDVVQLLTQKSYIPDIPLPSTNLNEVEVNDKGSPVPTEGEMIPYSNHWWLSTRPDGTFPTENEVDAFKRKTSSLTDYYNYSEGNQKIKNIIDFLWNYLHIPIIYLWIFGILGIIFTNGKDRLYLLIILILLIAYIAGTLIGTPPWLKYRLPLDSAILIFGIIGLSSFIKRLIKYK